MSPLNRSFLSGHGGPSVQFSRRPLVLCSFQWGSRFNQAKHENQSTTSLFPRGNHWASGVGLSKHTNTEKDAGNLEHHTNRRHTCSRWLLNLDFRAEAVAIWRSANFDACPRFDVDLRFLFGCRLAATDSLVRRHAQAALLLAFPFHVNVRSRRGRTHMFRSSN